MVAGRKLHTDRRNLSLIHSSPSRRVLLGADWRIMVRNKAPNNHRPASSSSSSSSRIQLCEEINLSVFGASSYITTFLMVPHAAINPTEEKSVSVLDVESLFSPCSSRWLDYCTKVMKSCAHTNESILLYSIEGWWLHSIDATSGSPRLDTEAGGDRPKKEMQHFCVPLLPD